MFGEAGLQNVDCCGFINLGKEIDWQKDAAFGRWSLLGEDGGLVFGILILLRFSVPGHRCDARRKDGKFVGLLDVGNGCFKHVLASQHKTVINQALCQLKRITLRHHDFHYDAARIPQ